MTLDREELEELVRRVIAEERAEAMAHPGRREKFTRYTDPDGKTWVSSTLERSEIITKLAGLITALTIIVSAANYIILRSTVYPAIDQRIEAHNDAATKKMNEMLPNIVQRGEFDRRVAASDARWSQADERYEVLIEWMTRVESKLDRAIERGR